MKLRNIVSYLIASGVALIAFSTLASGFAAIETAPGNTIEPGGLLVLGLALAAVGLLVRARDSS